MLSFKFIENSNNLLWMTQKAYLCQLIISYLNYLAFNISQFFLMRFNPFFLRHNNSRISLTANHYVPNNFRTFGYKYILCVTVLF